MSRIFLAWELGTGYGHLGPFRPVAEILIARGHEVTVAAREVQNAPPVFGALPVRVVQAPLCIKTYSGIAEPPLNYAEILMRYGYLDAPQLKGMLRAWRGLLDIVRPDVLIADHAPTALLAARGMALPRALTGTAFAVPPPVMPTPNMRSWVDVPAQRLANSDAAVLECINACLSGVPPLGAVHEIFSGAVGFLSGVPELDPYGPRSEPGCLGLYGGRFGASAPVWPAGEGPRVFAYLAGDYRHIDAALAALAESGARCSIYMRDVNAAARDKYAGGRIVFNDTAVDLDAAVADSELCACHGNVGTVMNILRGGKPMLLLPMQLEHFLIASRLDALGIAAVAHSETAAPDIAGALARALRQPSLSEAARAFAAKHCEPSVDTIVESVASRIEAMAQTRGQTG